MSGGQVTLGGTLLHDRTLYIDTDKYFFLFAQVMHERFAAKHFIDI